MPVKLLVKHYRGQPPAAELSCLIDTAGTLGRAPGNDLVLDDPGKYISRAHARIEQRADGYYLVDIGSNPSVLNERLLGHGQETLLHSADVLVIGDYQIDIAVLDDATRDPDQTSADGTQTLAVFVPPSVPEPTPLPPLQPLLQSAEVPRDTAGFSQPQVQTDALAAASILQGEASFEPSTPLADPLGLGLLSGSASPALFEAAPAPVFAAAQSDHLSPEQHALPVTPAPLREPPARIPDDYDALADRVAQPAAATPRVQMQEQAPPPAPVPEAVPAAGDDTVLEALLDGLGLPQLRTSRSPQALARLVGEMLREATAGTMGVLMTRALTKRESHIEMTMIGAHSNNPLKFFPDATSALSQMLSTDAPAYLAGVPALRAAFDDLRAHEMAVIAGMREALGEVVQRFEPERIAQDLAAPSTVQRLLPSTRKAQLWARFSERYAQLVRDGDEDLQRIFVEKFSVAYQQQVSRLRDLP